MTTKKKYYLIILFLVLIIGIGYAYLTTNLNIIGTTNVGASTWDVYWDNVQVTEGSVTASTPVIDTNKTTVSFNVHLSKPGDYYEFTVDAKNAGTIDAMIDVLTSTLNGNPISTLPSYLNYSVTYSDDVPIKEKHELNAGTTETIKVRVEYKSEISASDLPSTAQSLSLSFGITYVQKDSNAIPVYHTEGFGADSWDTIVNIVRSGSASDFYHLGDTKTIDMGSFGTHTLRIANTSTPDECNQEGFSQTACGFVLEFTDILIIRSMNSYLSNLGSWPSCRLRSYINSNIYNAIPNDLKYFIIDTTVISGYGASDSSNFTSTDKLYLLSTHEVCIDDDGNPNTGIDKYDTAYNNTRQLDYYNSIGVSTSSHTGAGKTYNSTNYNWWLRCPFSSSSSTFYFIPSTDNGIPGGSYSDVSTIGVSPAFRIG